ncbi:MAG: hypothetical protein WCP77_07400, partial [Roseococcus sp.]
LMVAPASTMNRCSSTADTTLVKAVGRAFRWRQMMETGSFATINELAAVGAFEPPYVSRLRRLMRPAPEPAEAGLDGQPNRMTLAGLMKPFSLAWGLMRFRPSTPAGIGHPAC